jgi:hypothetical protein
VLNFCGLSRADYEVWSADEKVPGDWRSLERSGVGHDARILQSIWSAALLPEGTKRSRDTAFERCEASECLIDFRADESGVALRFPPQSKTLVDWRWTLKFAKRLAVWMKSARGLAQSKSGRKTRGLQSGSKAERDLVNRKSNIVNDALMVRARFGCDLILGGGFLIKVKLKRRIRRDTAAKREQVTNERLKSDL